MDANDDQPPHIPTNRRITKLDPSVINRIAAGEVIHRPSHAIKELLENSLDAGASSIQITVRDGGLKLLEISDNGHGIHHDDLPIVAQRFTTSKLSVVDDLLSVSTFGFRGEALASLSHVAHLSITTRTADSQCGYRGRYIDGVLVPDQVDPCAHPLGTTISVSDLFYNLPTRKRGMRSANEEHSSIADTMSRYAVHYPNVAMILRKQGMAAPDVSTAGNQSTVDVVQAIYGANVAREIVSFTHAFGPNIGSMSAIVSHPNYSSKANMTFLLFINHRLVESASIKRAIKSLYARFLPKNTNPWVYLSLDLPLHTVDVNVHPTKKEVHFLHSDFIVGLIVETIAGKLDELNTSRHFKVNVLAPSTPTSLQKRKRDSELQQENVGISTGKGLGSCGNQSQLVPRVGAPSTQIISPSSEVAQPGLQSREFQLVRTGRVGVNSTQGQLVPGTSAPSTQIASTPSKAGRPGLQRRESQLVRTDSRTTTLHRYFGPSSDNPASTSQVSVSAIWQPRAGTIRDLKLTSVAELRAELDATATVPGIMKDHTYVGWVRDASVAVQSGLDLYLADIGVLADNLYYRLALKHFSNYPVIYLDPPLAIPYALRCALDLPEAGWHSELAPKDEISNFIAQELAARKDMLADYFSLEITNTHPTDASDHRPHIVSIPQLQLGYVPPLIGVPMFLLRLGTEINWTEEKACLAGLLDELAMFYTPRGPGAFVASDASHEVKYAHVDLHVLEHVILPAMRTMPVSEELAKRAFIRLANLHELYKVFERC